MLIIYNITGNCGPLVLEGGNVLLRGSSIGSVATFKCFSGYKLVGNHVVQCQKTGQWAGKKPGCKRMLK